MWVTILPIGNDGSHFAYGHDGHSAAFFRPKTFLYRPIGMKRGTFFEHVQNELFSKRHDESKRFKIKRWNELETQKFGKPFAFYQ